MKEDVLRQETIGYELGTKFEEQYKVIKQFAN